MGAGKDNLRLKDANRRLRQYGQDVQEATREKRSCAPKPAFTTRSATRSACRPGSFSDAGRCRKRLCRMAERIRLLLGKYADEQTSIHFDQLAHAACAIM